MVLNRLSLTVVILALGLVACTSRAVPTPAAVPTGTTQTGITEEAAPTEAAPTATSTQVRAPSPTASARFPAGNPTTTPTQPPFGEALTETPSGPEPTWEPSPSPTEPPIDPNTPGTVSGEVCSPGEDSRAKTAYFENVDTYELNPLPVARDQTAYSLDLAPGQYIAYAYEKHLKAKGGLYSQAVACGLTAGCTDHNPLVFTVEPGQAVGEIDICDWSAAEHIPPNPAPVDERLAGMVYTVYGVNYFRFDEQGKAQFLMSVPYNPEVPFRLAVSPDGRRGVFKDEEKNDLFLVDFFSDEQFNLTNTPQINETAYRWWPKLPGTILFWALFEGEGPEPGYDGMLHLVDVDGSDRKAIDAEHGPAVSDISPDGRTIAYGAGETGFLYRRDSGISEFDPREYSSDLPEDVSISSPSWSPDGKKIAWHIRGSYNDEYLTGYGIFDLTAKDFQLIYTYKGNGYGGYPSPAVWSPVGNWLAIPVHAGDPRDSGIWLVNASRPEEEYFLGESTYGPYWHPEGKWLAYTRQDAYGGRQFSEVWLLDADNPEQRVMMGESTSGGWWSRDGKWLAYEQADQSSGTIQVWLYNLNTGEREKSPLSLRQRVEDW